MESIPPLICYKKQITQRSIIYTLIFLCELFRSSLATQKKNVNKNNIFFSELQISSYITIHVSMCVER